jgi:hypothetical protein
MIISLYGNILLYVLPIVTSDILNFSTIYYFFISTSSFNYILNNKLAAAIDYG